MYLVFVKPNRNNVYTKTSKKMELIFEKLDNSGYVYTFDGKNMADNYGSLMLFTKNPNGIEKINMGYKYKFMLGDSEKRFSVKLSYNQILRLVLKHKDIHQELIKNGFDFEEEKSLINFMLLVDVLKSNYVVF